MCCCPSEPANKPWLQEDCKLPLLYPCLSASLLFWARSKCHFTTDHLDTNLQNIQRGQTKSPRKLSLAASESSCFRKCAKKKGKFRFILPLPWASSFWQAELKDIFVLLYSTSLKSLFWSQSVQSLFDCILILAFMASSINHLHGLVICVC